ncbi:ATP-binding protein [Tumidithrix elongata RA019]|uniref:ATP-binding protein n=1 Tax=Tumidithrix elongata BACA0141 TaxID=2716417 RepID=A0AAW9PR68_9CYAN|nr:ATP-binding protein [Tumidithrix elongata RA019]
MLKELHLQGIGPAPKFDIEFGDRLNILTGDNGLGKSFLLDVAWFALTESWADSIVIPDSKSGSPEIKASISHENYTIPFHFSNQQWDRKSSRIQTAIVIYCRVDGNFSVYDPLRHYFTRFTQARAATRYYHFTPSTLWHGLRSNEDKVICNGLIHDWVYWQNQRDRTIFNLLRAVIKKLAHPQEPIKVAKPRRVLLDDVRDIPTVDLPYGNVPLTQTSSGLRRVLNFAYLLVWSWYEHRQACKLTKQKPVNQIILLIDEVELHLHPKWQRTILPAILEVVKILNPDVKIQVVATTHSPLVLASAEPYFDEETDKLFLFKQEGKTVDLEELAWTKFGDANNWLTSPIFELQRPKSLEAERAIEAAYTLMRGDSLEEFPNNLRSQESIHQELLKVVPDNDSFWRRWVVTAE